MGRISQVSSSSSRSSTSTSRLGVLLYIWSCVPLYVCSVTYVCLGDANPHDDGPDIQETLYAALIRNQTLSWGLAHVPFSPPSRPIGSYIRPTDNLYKPSSSLIFIPSDRHTRYRFDSTGGIESGRRTGNDIWLMDRYVWARLSHSRRARLSAICGKNEFGAGSKM